MEVLGHEVGQLFVYVAIHVEVVLVLLSRSVYIVACAESECPVLIDPLNGNISRGGVREDASDLVRLSIDAEVALNGEIFMVGLEAGEEVDDRVGLASLLLDSIVWQVDVEGHLTVVDLAPVLHSLERTAAVFNTANDLHLARWGLLEGRDLNHSSEAITGVQRVH